MHSVQDALGDSEHTMKINQSPDTSDRPWVISGAYILGTVSLNLRLVTGSYN